MKKHVFTFVAFFVMCMASLDLVSCSDDDKDDSQVDKSILVGKWVMINLVEEYGDETLSYSFDVSEEEDIVLFNENGSCFNYNDKGWFDKGNWSLSDTTLKLLFYGEGQQTVKILKMTETIFTFECLLENEKKEGEFFKCTATYQKVK